MFTRLVTIFIVFFVSDSAVAQESVESWTIVPTERHILKSKILDRNVRIQVSVPAGYNLTKETYPVVYFPDDFALGGLVRETTNALTKWKNIPSVITVGIEMEVNTRDEWFKERAYILTPSQSDIFTEYGVQKSWTGGAEFFLASLESEIIPFIEANYATKENDRALVGHSFGGLFALYSLFEKPSLFNRYVISSPSLEWDDGIIFKMEEAYAKKSKHLSAKVFLNYGALETGLTEFKDFVPILKGRNYQGLKVTGKLYEGENHMSVRSPAYNEGLKVIFARDKQASKNE